MRSARFFASLLALAACVFSATTARAVTPIFLVDGEDPSGALAHARTAHGLLPGDPEIALLSAKLELAHGDREAARRTAIREVTRARSAPDLEAARSVLAQIDEHASIH